MERGRGIKIKTLSSNESQTGNHNATVLPPLSKEWENDPHVPMISAAYPLCYIVTDVQSTYS